MTPLAERLARRIAATGPITLADYMADCMLDPEHGYYASRDPLGSSGDFTTAPEISQMFGELAGLALAQTWADQGAAPAPILAELGPGRGTLMADIRRALPAAPAFADTHTVHLVEASPALRASQAATLGETATWHDRLEDLPEAPLFLVANEFFDALPVRQFQRDPAGWRERQVAVDAGTLTLALSEPAPIAALDHRLADTTPGEVIELRPAADAIVAEIARRIAAHGGAALIVDYGGWRSRGDTLQAVRGHAPEDPFAAPGDADLTAHLDFEALAEAAGDVAVTPMTPQGMWLERLGITARAEALARNLTGAARESHIAAHRRLTHPDEMGSLFKAIALHPAGTSPPPGFAP